MITRNTEELLRRRRKILRWIGIVIFFLSLLPLFYLMRPSNIFYLCLQPIVLAAKFYIVYLVEPGYVWRKIYYALTMATTVPLLISMFMLIAFIQITLKVGLSAVTGFWKRLNDSPFELLVLAVLFSAVGVLLCIVQNVIYRDYCRLYMRKKIEDILKKSWPGFHQENWAETVPYPVTAEIENSNSRSGISFPDVWTEFDVNSFKEIKEIGRGGQGQVFRAKAGRFGYVAVKVYNNGCEVNSREINSMQQFTHHPNIIRLFGYVQNLAIDNFQTNRIGYVMEYLENGSVHDAIYNWNPPYTYDTGLSWICQVGRGLGYLHDKNVIHRDVKPRNLLLCNERKMVKLCDFGLARVFGDEATMTTFVGTPKYMAPEMIRGRDQSYSAGVDVYSMAITAWKILVRRDPFGHLGSSSSASNFDISQAIVNGERPVSSAINDSDMEVILKQAWSEKETDRPSMEEMSTFFEEKCPKPETELRRRGRSGVSDDSGYDETVTEIDQTANEATLGKKILLTTSSSFGSAVVASIPAVLNYIVGGD